MATTEQKLAQEIILMAGTDVKQCMQCGKCSASCPMGNVMEFLPHRFVWELMQGRAERLLASRSAWQCLSCFACEARCPRGVSPVNLMEAVRLTVIRQQGANTLSLDELPSKLDEQMPQQAIVAALRKYNK
ncbi:MAG: 4Fe-4S dicluster domain-containing protein [Acidaminococcaceae bacterium]